jgi:hypothetical protein
MPKRSLRSGLVVALASVLLSGCWLQVGFDAGHTRHNDLEDQLTAANVATLAPTWSANLLEAASEPIVRGDRVYVTTGGRDAASGEARIATRAYAIATGTPAWNRTFGTLCCGSPGIVYTPPSFVGDELWTGWFLVDSSPRPRGGYQSPVRLDPADGSIIASEAYISTSAAVTAEGIVAHTALSVGGSTSRSLVVRDATTKAIVWTAALPGSFTEVPVAPAVVDGQIFVADRTSLSAFPAAGCGAATCTPTWTLDLGNPLGSVVAARGGHDVFTVSGNDLVAVARTTGTVSWRTPLGAAAPGLALAGGTLYAGAGTTLHAVPAAGCGAATCAVTWTAPLAAAASTAPAVAGGVVYVGGDGAVGAFAAAGCGAATCPALASVTVSGVPDQLSVDGGRVFVVSHPATGTGVSTLTAFAPAG